MHSMLVGMSESGKTLLGKMLARSYVRNKKRVLALDPLLSRWESGVEVTDSIEELVSWMKDTENRSSYVFIDEAGEVFSEGRNTQYNFVTTRSRHYGHSVHLLGQRYVQIPKTMRDQCGRLYLFAVSKNDAIEAAIEYNKPELEDASNLPRFHFYIVDRFAPLRMAKIVDFTRVEFVKESNESSK